MLYFLSVWLPGALPILLVAWLLRKASSKDITPVSGVVSVLFAMMIGTAILGFMEGEGGFWARLSNVRDANQLVNTIPSAFIALSVVLFVGWAVHAGKSQIEENN